MFSVCDMNYKFVKNDESEVFSTHARCVDKFRFRQKTSSGLPRHSGRSQMIDLFYGFTKLNDSFDGLPN